MSTDNIPFLNIKKEIHPELSQICNYGICSKGPKNEFEPAVVNEPSVFEPLKFYCIQRVIHSPIPKLELSEQSFVGSSS